MDDRLSIPIPKASHAAKMEWICNRKPLSWQSGCMRRILNYIRNFLLFKVRYPWVQYGRDVHVQWSTQFWSPHRKIRLGNHVGIGRMCDISVDLTLGNHVLVASAVAFQSRDAHMPYIPGTTMFDSPPGNRWSIVVEDDVWIGFGAIILSGVRIGRGSIIGAGAIVTQDIPPYSVVLVQPAEVRKQRFTPDEVEIHEAALRSQGVILSEQPKDL